MNLEKEIEKTLKEHHEFCECEVCKSKEWRVDVIQDIKVLFNKYLESIVPDRTYHFILDGKDEAFFKVSDIKANIKKLKI